MKKTIRIGRPNKEQFDSAYALIHGCASINQSLRGYYAESYNGTHRIGLNDTEYVYDDSLEIVARFDNADGEDADSQEEGRFLLEGASWFDGLRGGKPKSATATWVNFIETLADAYHRQYSVMEFTQSGEKQTDAEKGQLIGKLMNVFYKDVWNGKNVQRKIEAVKQVEGSDSVLDTTEDIYEVSMRLMLNAGGAPRIVLGTVYFRNRGNGAMALPMGKEDALRIHKILENIGVGSGNPLRAEDVTKIKNNALQALDNLSKGTVAARSGMRTFNDCILISDLGKRRSTGEPILDLDELEELIKENADDVIFGQDGTIIQEIKDSMLNNASKIECTGIKVLGIVHLRWKNSAYDVSLNGKKYFRFMFGLNDSVAIKCLNCVESCTNEAESYIVDENAILLEENKFIRIRDVNAENLGLTQEDFALIEKKGIFKKHLQKVGNSKECQMMGCKDKLCCVSQIFMDGEKRYCKTCRYPEIVYFDPLASTEEEGQLSLTKRLNFYIDEMAMRPIDKNAKPCADCRRLIRKGVRCSLCSINENTLNEEEKQKAEALYREYADMLPVSLRTFSMFSKKYCFEDVGTILFIIGADRYYFHKTSIHDKGYLLPVKKVNSYTKK